jgi:hypothetical protein
MIGVVVLATASDPRPSDNNVVAGWVGAVVLIAVVIVVVLILRSFTKHLKKVNAAADAGVYGDQPTGSRAERPDGSEESGGSEEAGTPPPSSAERDG